MSEIRLEMCSLREGCFAVRLHGDTIAVGDNPLPTAARRLLGKHECRSDDVISLWWDQTRVCSGVAGTLAAIYPAVDPEPIAEPVPEPQPTSARPGRVRAWRHA